MRWHVLFMICPLDCFPEFVVVYQFNLPEFKDQDINTDILQLHMVFTLYSHIYSVILGRTIL